jgi:hypothetical protein
MERLKSPSINGVKHRVSISMAHNIKKILQAKTVDAHGIQPGF